MVCSNSVGVTFLEWENPEHKKRTCAECPERGSYPPASCQLEHLKKHPYPTTTICPFRERIPGSQLVRYPINLPIWSSSPPLLAQLSGQKTSLNSRLKLTNYTTWIFIMLAKIPAKSKRRRFNLRKQLSSIDTPTSWAQLLQIFGPKVWSHCIARFPNPKPSS